MQKRRLLKLASLLEANAENKTGVKFDLGTWGSVDNLSAPVSCGTTACAMGLAVVAGTFAKEGLHNHYSTPDVICPRLGEAVGLEAAEELFNISEAAAAFLFFDDNYPTTKRQGASAERYVAKRIRKFVAGETRIKA